MFKFLKEIIDNETKPVKSSNNGSASSKAFTRLLLEERYEVSNLSLECVRLLPELLSIAVVVSTHTGDIGDPKPPSGNSQVMQLCCDSLFAAILPHKCKECKEKAEKVVDEQLKGGVEESSSMILSDPITLKNFTSMAESLDTLLLHGLNFSSQPTYGTSQVRQCCRGLLTVVGLLAEEEDKKLYSWIPDDLASIRKEEKKRRPASGLTPEFQNHVQTLRRTTRKLRGLPWYEKVVRKTTGESAVPDNSIMLARAWIRCAMSVSGGLDSYCWLLLHGTNRSTVLHGSFAPWSLWRANLAEDAAVKNATIILARMGKLHVVELKLEGEEVFRQWWPLPFKSYKARQKFDDEFNPKKIPTPGVIGQGWAVPGNKKGTQSPSNASRRIEDTVKRAGKKIKDEIKNTNTIEEGMDKFADIVDQGIAAVLNLYDGSEGTGTAKPMGHTSFKSGGTDLCGSSVAGARCDAVGEQTETYEHLENPLFRTSIDTLSKSTAFSSSMASYDSNLAPPTAILKVISIIDDNVDTAGIFYDNVNVLPNADMVEKMTGMVPGETISAIEASAFLVHWLRSLPQPMVPCRDALISASGLPDVEERRRNVKLLLEASLTAPASILFMKLLRLLEVATNHTHSRRNELTAVRATLLLAPVLMGSGGVEADIGIRARRDSRETSDLQNAVETAEIMRTILTDVDFYVEGMNADIKARETRLRARLDTLNFLRTQFNRNLDVRLIEEGGTDGTDGDGMSGEKYVEGGTGEHGAEDVELVMDFIRLMKRGRDEKEEGSVVLRTSNIFSNVKNDLHSTSVLCLLSMAHFVTNYEKQASHVFERLRNGIPTISQMSQQFVSIVGGAVGIGKTNAKWDMENAKETDAPLHFVLLSSKEGIAEGEGGERMTGTIKSLTVGSVEVFCELTTICWLILQDDFEGGLAKVREGFTATLCCADGSKALRVEDCWDNYVKLKEGWLVRKAESGEEERGRVLDVMGGGGEGWGPQKVWEEGREFAKDGGKFLKNSRILDEKMLKQISKDFPHYVQRRAIMKIYDSYQGTNGDDDALTTFYNSTDGHSYTLLLIRDETGKIFGAFADEQWRNKGDVFYGSKDCFIFEKNKAGKITVYRHPEEKNAKRSVGNLFMIGNQEFLGMGSGESGTFALYLDQDLCMGSSSSSTTFGNSKPISGIEEFIIENLEVWGFDI